MEKFIQIGIHFSMQIKSLPLYNDPADKYNGYIDGPVQGCSNSIANTLDWRQSCT